MGTPLATLSATEFHPQCVTKHPTAACDSTRT
jgi:hypothetical protein